MSKANFRRFNSAFVQIVDSINGGRYIGAPPFPQAGQVSLDTEADYFKRYLETARAVTADPQWDGQPLGDAARQFLYEYAHPKPRRT